MSFINHLRTANTYLPWIVLVGIALGVANYSMGIWPTLGQSIFQQISISFIIGYGLFVVNDYVASVSITRGIKYIILTCGFTFLGLLGTEMEALIRTYIFDEGIYSFFSGEGTYMFNIILSNILGFTVYYWTSKTESVAEINDNLQADPTPNLPITTIPIKEGETTSLYPLSDVLYFEAYDNYAFLHNENGDRILASNSLIDLERKLGSNFLRVHRKYLINRDQIHQVQPHLKGRYTIIFSDQSRTSIISSASYAEVIKGIIKI